MRTLCIKLPRSALSQATAIYETEWNITTAGAFEQLLDEIHDSITTPFSLEIYSTKQLVMLCFTAPHESTLEFISSTVYAMMPDAEIVEVPDYTFQIEEGSDIAVTEFKTMKDHIYQLQNFAVLRFETMQPVAGALSQFPADDKIIVQIICRKVGDTTKHHINFFFRRLRDHLLQLFRVKYWFKVEVRKAVLEKINIKSKKRTFDVTMRVAAIIPPPAQLTEHEIKLGLKSHRGTDPVAHLKVLASAYSFVNTADNQQLKLGEIIRGKEALKPLQERSFGRMLMFMPLEVTTLWHPPKLGAIPNTAAVLAAKAGPPANVPEKLDDPEISFFGRSDFRDHRVAFGIRRLDRRRHLYAVGKSGTGKSCLLELLVRSDIENGYGAAVLDPHGDLVDNILKNIPEHRVKDVVVFDATDFNFPPSFNPLADVPPAYMMRLAILYVEIFQSVFGRAWNDQIALVLRNSLIPLISQSGTTLLSLRRFLVDASFRKLVLEGVDDHSVHYFWEHEYNARKKELQERAIDPLLNLLGELFASDTLRNILGQPMNRFKFNDIMDNRKILLIKLSRGILGEENSSLLGLLLITRIYLAALTRADQPPEKRQDFYLYIDELQKFANEYFDEILSESRKYKLNLTMVNQFLGQLSPKVRSTLLGNVGTIMTFRVGGEDSPLLAKEFAPRICQEDLINLGLRDFYVKMSIDGRTQEAFSGRTLELDYKEERSKFKQVCVEQSRSNYAMPIDQVNEIIGLWEEGVEPLSDGARSN